MAEPSLAASVRLVNGHPDDQNAENAALAVLAANAPTYNGAWPRETAYRFLHAMSNGPEAARTAGAPTEKDLATFVRAHAPSREREAFKVHSAALLYEAVHGSDRVASEIVAHFERRADALWAVTDRNDHVFTLLDALALVRDRMTHSDRSRLDARIRVLLAFHAKDAPVARELASILERPESIVPPPQEETASLSSGTLTTPADPPSVEAKPKKPAKKKAAKKKAK